MNARFEHVDSTDDKATPPAWCELATPSDARDDIVHGRGTAARFVGPSGTEYEVTPEWYEDEGSQLVIRSTRRSTVQGQTTTDVETMVVSGMDDARMLHAALGAALERMAMA